MEKVAFGMLKPDALERGLVNEVFNRIIKDGFTFLIIQKKFLTQEDVLILYGYASHRSFYSSLEENLINNEVILFLVRSEDQIDSVKKLNKLVGHTDPLLAKSGTLRELGESVARNLVHSSSDFNELVVSMNHFFSRSQLDNIFKALD